MRLYATITSERATKGQGGNEYILVEFKTGSRDKNEIIGQVELYLYDDDKQYGSEENEWLLKFRNGGDDEDNDWDILTQGHIPSISKGKQQKGKSEYVIESKKPNDDDFTDFINKGLLHE